MLCSVRMMAEAGFQQLVALAATFTTTLIGSLYDSANSLAYLFHFWYRLCQDVGRLLSDVYSQLSAFLEAQLLVVVEAYLAKRLNDVPDWADSAEDDPLTATDACYWELVFLGGMIRFHYNKGMKVVADLYDGVNKEYTVRACERREG